MTRTVDPNIRTKLLNDIVEYILKRGVGNLSLRPLATALDTSPRMLLYFFGSKEHLIAEALTQARTRHQEEWTRFLMARGKRRGRLALAWEVWSSEENKWLMWFFFEVYALAMRNRKRFPGFLEGMVKDWLPFFEQAVEEAGAEPRQVTPLATFILATIRGLHLDLLATDEKDRVDGAFREMLQLSLPRSRVARNVIKRSHAKERARSNAREGGNSDLH
jgi:AcrR family transcriptional regulator